jgi:hypothetical protein
MSLNIMDIICKETNREGNRVFGNNWRDLTVSEFWSKSVSIPTGRFI